MRKRNKNHETLIVRIIDTLSLGEPLPRLWVLYFGTGSICFGLLSYPSSGTAKVLIPMFILSGLTNLYACVLSAKRDPTLESARKISFFGLGLMILASWTRAVIIWGVGQHGAGSTILASSVWLWITGGCAFLLIAVWQRGLR